ncbi:hypothetical protein D9615_008924 [Tricholomella constricta]|uniref:CCHC-type domain-containing protein n=1 Tax=Tricholomella constricta TaxID=117010 RepID=A0A8H5LZ42_9AGAR|nr:hypothetical protein D9615_008924 [Tricholomella constricta]
MALYSIPSSFNSMLSDILPLGDSNWFEWSQNMDMALLGIGMEGVTGTGAPAGLDGKDMKDWKAADTRLTAFIYRKVDAEYCYLLLHHGPSNARAEFYAITHDPDRSIHAYLEALQSARRKMEALGCKVDDTEFKDVLLMHLDTTFHSVQLNILAQTAEPELAKIKSMLNSSTAADVMVKSEDVRARAGQRGSGRKEGSEGYVDSKGFRWCDISSDNCHRCGCSGHIAARCMYNMPSHIKDLISKNRPRSPSPPPHAHVAEVHVASSARSVKFSSPHILPPDDFPDDGQFDFSGDNEDDEEDYNPNVPLRA